MATHPAAAIEESIGDCDFGVLDHGWAKYGRDYLMVLQGSHGRASGTYRVAFTHCVNLEYETRVGDGIWGRSWGDEFISYKDWEAAENPGGYVWGTNWSLAYPGIAGVDDSALSRDWSARLGKTMVETTLETDRFFIRLIHHSIRMQKLSDDTSTVDQVTHTLVSDDPGSMPLDLLGDPPKEE